MWWLLSWEKRLQITVSSVIVYFDRLVNVDLGGLVCVAQLRSMILVACLGRPLGGNSGDGSLSVSFPYFCHCLYT